MDGVKRLRLSQGVEQMGHQGGQVFFILGRQNPTVDFKGGIGGDGLLNRRFGQRMYGHFTPGNNPALVEHQRSSTVSDQKLAGLAEGLKNAQHVLIVRGRSLFGKAGNGISATEDNGIVFCFVSFQLGHRIVQRDRNARIGADVRRVSDRKGAERNAVFEKIFCILK